MANHIYATAEFTDYQDEDWKIVMHKMESGTDSGRTFHVGSEGFVLTYENSDEYNVIASVQPSSVEFTMMYETGDATYFEDAFDDILSGEDGLFCISIYRDQDGDNDLFWRGFILPEAITVEFQSTYPAVTIRCTDGLGTLSTVDFDYDLPVSVPGVGPRITDGIIFCLNKLPQIELYSSNAIVGLVDDFIASNYSLYSTDYSTQKFTYNFFRIAYQTWLNVDNDGTPQYYTCREYLDSVCLSFNASLFLDDGKFLLVPLGAMQDGTNIFAANYDNQVSLVNSLVDVKLPVTYGPGENFVQMNGWVRTAAPPHGEVKLTRVYQGDKPVLASSSLDLDTRVYDESITYEVDNKFQVSGNFLYRFDGIPSGTTDDNRFGRIVLAISLELGDDDTDTTNNRYVKRNYNIGSTSYIHAGIDNFNVDFVNTLEVGADGYDEIQWTNDDTDEYFLILPYVIDRENGTGASIYDAYYLNKHFTFVTPNIPVELTRIGLKIRAFGIEADGTVNNDFLSTTFAEYELRNVRVQYTTGTQNEEFGSIEIKATSTGRYNVNLGQSLIGDRVASETFGLIKVLNTSALYEPAVDWRSRQSTTTELGINQLAVTERMAFYRRGKRIQRGTLLRTSQNGRIAPHAIFTDDVTGDTYFASQIKFIATRAEYDVTLLRDSRNTGSIVIKDDNPLATPSVGLPDSGNIGGNPLGNMSGNDAITTAYNTYNRNARQNFALDWSSVIGAGETKEAYWTLANDGAGKYFNYQGESPASGYNIKRTIYVRSLSEQTPSDNPWSTPTFLVPALNDSLESVLQLCQRYMGKEVSNSAYTFMITYKEVNVNYLLDNYSGSVAAYGLRQLRSAYSGGAIGVRRSSDNLTASIGFDSNGDLNETALLNFVGNTASDFGYVEYWYDQTSNSRHLRQTSTTAQPRIVNAGVVEKLNGKPAMYLDGSNDYLPIAAGTVDLNSNVTSLLVEWVGSVNDLTVGQNMVSHWNSSAGSQVFQMQMTASNDNLRAQHRYSNGTLSTADTGYAITSGHQYIAVAHTEQNKHEAYYEGVKKTGTNVNAAPNNATTSFSVGSRSDNQAGPHKGYTQEVIIWSTTTSSHDAANISDDVNSYFNSYT